MALLGSVSKQPAERLDWDLDYVNWLTPGDNLTDESASTVLISGSDSALTVWAKFVDGTRLKIYLQGGTHGTTYKVTVTTQTADSRIKQDEFKVIVKDA